MSSVYWLARASVNIAGWTPRPVRYALGSTFSSASYLGWRSKRQITQQNMARVLDLPIGDPRVKRAASASWSRYGRTASDLIYFPHANMDRIEARLQDMTQGATWIEYIQQGLDAGHGAIVSTAHFGNWDMAGAIAARHFPLMGITESFKDPRLNTLLQGHRLEKQVGVIPMEQSLRQVGPALAQNKVVAIVADRPMSKEKGVEITFFGHTTYVPGGPAAFALKAGAAIVPGYVWYGPAGQFLVRAFPPAFPQPYEGREGRTREIARLTQYMYDAQEEMVRSCPTQWFMFRSFWPAETQP